LLLLLLLLLLSSLFLLFLLLFCAVDDLLKKKTVFFLVHFQQKIKLLQFGWNCEKGSSFVTVWVRQKFWLFLGRNHLWIFIKRMSNCRLCLARSFYLFLQTLCFVFCVRNCCITGTEWRAHKKHYNWIFNFDFFHRAFLTSALLLLLLLFRKHSSCWINFMEQVEGQEN
jgi:hypothetical protein